jgi:hypothetical protein
MAIDQGGGVQPGPASAPGIDLLLRDHEIDRERAPPGPCFCHRILRIRVRHVTNVASGAYHQQGIVFGPSGGLSSVHRRVLTAGGGRSVRLSMTNSAPLSGGERHVFILMFLISCSRLHLISLEYESAWSADQCRSSRPTSASSGWLTPIDVWKENAWRRKDHAFAS